MKNTSCPVKYEFQIFFSNLLVILLCYIVFHHYTGLIYVKTLLMTNWNSNLTEHLIFLSGHSLWQKKFCLCPPSRTFFPPGSMSEPHAIGFHFPSTASLQTGMCAYPDLSFCFDKGGIQFHDTCSELSSGVIILHVSVFWVTGSLSSKPLSDFDHEKQPNCSVSECLNVPNCVFYILLPLLCVWFFYSLHLLKFLDQAKIVLSEKDASFLRNINKKFI